ncbi:hypothetical protein GCM10010275_27120 [Streptomyces litmocidini]|uniref:hypothetical protein n=1 Tax=Streptomyces litmocidini TaxID=67318 RepID=UPI00167DB31F|nr:hypothetical protein [Streptomyces litmocidini]GGU89270.1 hypothetical protein GCM10010275_27120 [Streptomyces litmocidini]
MSSAAPYRRTNLPLAQPATTFLWQSAGAGRVEATGECPECRCVTTRVWEEIQYVTKGPSGPDKQAFDNGEPKFAQCHCPTWHVNRPAEIPDGCGATFWIALPPQGLSL